MALQSRLLQRLIHGDGYVITSVHDTTS